MREKADTTCFPSRSCGNTGFVTQKFWLFIITLAILKDNATSKLKDDTMSDDECCKNAMEETTRLFKKFKPPLPEIPKERCKFYGKYAVTDHGHVWNVRLNREVKADRVKNNTYMKVRFIGKKFERVNRVVMKLFGPKNPNPDYFTCVDHIDHNTLNNAISNLRWLPKWQNSLWREIVKGWYKHKHKNKPYQARIRTPATGNISLGCYHTAEEANERYLECRDRAMQLSLGDLVIRSKDSIKSFVRTGEF